MAEIKLDNSMGWGRGRSLPDVFRSFLAKHPSTRPVAVYQSPFSVYEDRVPGVEGLSPAELHTCVKNYKVAYDSCDIT